MRHAAHRATTGSTWRARPGAAARSVDESALASLRIPIGLCQRRANLCERLSLDGVGHTRLRHGNHFLHKLVDGESLQPPSLDELLALRLELVAPAAFDEPASELRLEPAGSSGHHGWQVGRGARAREAARGGPSSVRGLARDRGAAIRPTRAHARGLGVGRRGAASAHLSLSPEAIMDACTRPSSAGAGVRPSILLPSPHQPRPTPRHFPGPSARPSRQSAPPTPKPNPLSSPTLALAVCSAPGDPPPPQRVRCGVGRVRPCVSSRMCTGVIQNFVSAVQKKMGLGNFDSVSRGFARPAEAVPIAFVVRLRFRGFGSGARQRTPRDLPERTAPAQ